MELNHNLLSILPLEVASMDINSFVYFFFPYFLKMLVHCYIALCVAC